MKSFIKSKLAFCFVKFADGWIRWASMDVHLPWGELETGIHGRPLRQSTYDGGNRDHDFDHRNEAELELAAFDPIRLGGEVR